jgi:hypothetical protein
VHSEPLRGLLTPGKRRPALRVNVLDKKAVFCGQMAVLRRNSGSSGRLNIRLNNQAKTQASQTAC